MIDEIREKIEERRDKRDERREKREEKREKRDEIREKREERREKREERREKRADGPQEAARGPEMKPPEGDRPFPTPSRLARIPRAYAVAMALPSPRPQAGWPNAARREQREEGREQRAASSIHCIFTVSRGHVEKVLKIRKVRPQIFTAYLRCFVTTSKSAEKYLSSLLPTV